MLKKITLITKLSALVACFLFLQACAVPRSPVSPTIPPRPVTLDTESHLRQGKRLFEQGYYKRAMKELLPLACDGNAEAQYAVGYMHYYGYGVCQDSNIGYFWIERSARQGFVPAHRALEMIASHCERPIKPCRKSCDDKAKL